MVAKNLLRNILNFLKRIFGSQLRLNMFSGVTTIFINMVILFVSYPVYLHYLGYEKYGLWLILAMVLGFAQLGMLGVSSAVMKLVAEEYGRDNLHAVQSYVLMALAVLTVTGGLVLLAILIFKGQIVALLRLEHENAAFIFKLLPYVGLLSIYVFLVQVLKSTLSGLGRMDLANYTYVAGRVVAVVISVLLLYFGYGAESLLVGNALSYVAMHIASIVFIHRKEKLRFLQLNNWDWGRFKKLLRFGGGVFGGRVMNMLLDPFYKLIVSRYIGVASIPIYEISYRGSMNIRAVIEAGLRPLMPEVSRISAEASPRAYQRIDAINRKLVRIVIISSIPVFGTLFVLAEILLKIWLRASFVDTLPGVFRIMMLGAFISLFTIPVYYTLVGLGRVGRVFVSHCILLVSSALVLLTTVLVGSTLRVSSVAWAFVVGMAIVALYLFWQKHCLIRRNLPGTCGSVGEHNEVS